MSKSKQNKEEKKDRKKKVRQWDEKNKDKESALLKLITWGHQEEHPLTEALWWEQHPLLSLPWCLPHPGAKETPQLSTRRPGGRALLSHTAPEGSPSCAPGLHGSQLAPPEDPRLEGPETAGVWQRCSTPTTKAQRWWSAPAFLLEVFLTHFLSHNWNTFQTTCKSK